MMPGVAMQEICDAIVDAYSVQSLTMTLQFLMNENLDVIVEPGAFSWRVFNLVQWADMNGRDIELVQTMGKSRAKNAKMQAVYKKYGMSIPVYVEKAGVSTPNSPTDATGSGLEKIVKDYLKFIEFGIWRERMTAVEGRVCLITIKGAAQGTGFLVGPDAVLTNYHVMAPALNGATTPSDFQCVFDFKKLPNGTTAGTSIQLHAADWNIDSSPFSPSEAAGAPDQTLPTADQLDYALVRLATLVGSQPWAQQLDATGATPGKIVNRGWISLPDVAPEFKSPMGVLIAQHPAGYPLKLAVDTDAINQANGLWLNAAKNRIRYATNTLGGSSGSPVFDLEWNLIALHHYGDPNYNHPAKYNQGIPIGLIRQRLEANGHADALGGPVN